VAIRRRSRLRRTRASGSAVSTLKAAKVVASFDSATAPSKAALDSLRAYPDDAAPTETSISCCSSTACPPSGSPIRTSGCASPVPTVREPACSAWTRGGSLTTSRRSLATGQPSVGSPTPADRGPHSTSPPPPRTCPGRARCRCSPRLFQRRRRTS
jgi:hypothetical protein